ncbi:hypothetical protein DL764_010114 [Monosporascus ibericus]|uniref:Uncharacterized protein n=1 Tax=Monosporascus ibericus TaxID=155417 RepID=A0A4Q4SV62_9PEZI|nr:hypothetical protein DL764_010114 [Monosporascus ibericus]
MQCESNIRITGGISGLRAIRPADRINKAIGQSSRIFLQLDLGDLAKVRAYARQWKAESYPPIHALVLNARLCFPGDLTRTRDGLEATFGINHVGHALLFHLLAPGPAPGGARPRTRRRPRRPHLQRHARLRAARRQVRHGLGAGATPGGRVARSARATVLRHQQARQPALGVKQFPEVVWFCPLISRFKNTQLS